MDWKVYAKSNELVSKTYQDSTHSNLIIGIGCQCIDVLPGIEPVCSKFRYAQMLASCLLYLGHRQGDRLGLFGGSQQKVDWMFPSGGRESFKSILTTIGGMIPVGEDLGDDSWNQFKANFPVRVRFVVISDFLENESRLEDYLSFASSHQCECICFQIIDPLEELLPDDEAVRFINLEGVGSCRLLPIVSVLSTKFGLPGT